MGSTQTEMTKPPVFGLLAHSSTWKSPLSTPIDNVDLAVQAALDTPDVAPWDLLDIVCIGDVAAWTLSHFIEAPFLFATDLWQLRVNLGIDPTGRIGTQYTRWKAGQFGDGPAPNPIAILVAHLLERFAWSDRGLRPMADYFRVTGLLGQGAGPARSYPLHALSDTALRELENHRADWAGSWCLDRMVIGT